MTNSIEKALENAQEKKAAAGKHAAKPAVKRAEGPEVLKGTIGAVKALVEHLENPPAGLDAAAEKAEPEIATTAATAPPAAEDNTKTGFNRLTDLAGAMIFKIVAIMAAIGSVLSWPIRVMRRVRASAAKPYHYVGTRAAHWVELAAFGAVLLCATIAVAWVMRIAQSADVRVSVVDGAPLLDEGWWSRTKFDWSDKRVETQVNRLDGRSSVTAVREDGSTYAYDPVRDGWVRRK